MNILIALPMRQRRDWRPPTKRMNCVCVRRSRLPKGGAVALNCFDQKNSVSASSASR
ncbi:hypothetical protein KCP73_01270 [Salmonella enterica subsp. enterica]|nr:hypothetical protein KCP73_01270 [Salmonella enterica subsp. enterica]